MCVSVCEHSHGWTVCVSINHALSVVWRRVASISTKQVPFFIFRGPMAMLFSQEDLSRKIGVKCLQAEGFLCYFTWPLTITLLRVWQKGCDLWGNSGNVRFQNWKFVNELQSSEWGGCRRYVNAQSFSSWMQPHLKCLAATKQGYICSLFENKCTQVGRTL